MLNERKENIPPRLDTPEVPLGAKLGGYEERRRKLQDERNREYNQLKSEVNLFYFNFFYRRQKYIHAIVCWLKIHFRVEQQKYCEIKSSCFQPNNKAKVEWLQSTSQPKPILKVRTTTQSRLCRLC